MAREQFMHPLRRSEQYWRLMALFQSTDRERAGNGHLIDRPGNPFADRLLCYSQRNGTFMIAVPYRPCYSSYRPCYSCTVRLELSRVQTTRHPCSRQDGTLAQQYLSAAPPRNPFFPSSHLYPLDLPTLPLHLYTLIIPLCSDRCTPINYPFRQNRYTTPSPTQPPATLLILASLR